jgi:hypothetical protein
VTWRKVVKEGPDTRGTLFFVHGTGVRQAGYNQTLGEVKAGATNAGIVGVSIEGCPWGPSLGVSADRVPDTLPLDISTRSVVTAPPTPAEIDLATWALLIEDPLFELRLAGQATGAAPTTVTVGGLSPDQAAVAMVTRLQTTIPDLTGTGLQNGDIVAAAKAVAASKELSSAAFAAKDPNKPELIQAMARAVTASILASHRYDPPGTEPAIALNGAIRGQLVQRIQDTMVPNSSRGAVGDWIKGKVVGFGESLATAFLISRRQGLTATSTAPLGDILFYQRRGEEIANFVIAALEQIKARPIVAVGHSLGGIILVDILSRTTHPVVDLLVTAGSQSPLFYAIDSLQSLRPQLQVPVPFTPWLNIYNRNDFLSYCATRIFPGVAGIWDMAVDPGVPFPASHSAYWHDPKVYDLILNHWPTTP